MKETKSATISNQPTMTTRRQFLQTIPATAAAFTIAGHMLLDEKPAIAKDISPAKGHFHPKGKPPSEHTLKVLRKARETLPFGDKKDFEEQKKGFIAFFLV